MNLRRLLSGAMAAVGALAVGAVVAPASAQAAAACDGTVICVWSDINYQGTYAAYSTGIQVFPTSLDHRISSVKVPKNSAHGWVFYAEKYYKKPIFCIGSNINLSNLVSWGHNDQFRSVAPRTTAACPAP